MNKRHSGKRGLLQLACVVLFFVLSWLYPNLSLAEGPPSITSINPSNGPAGTARVTITGSNFGGYTASPDYNPWADMDCNGEVKFPDFNRLANAYTGSGNPTFDPSADTDGDGDVDFTDFNTFANAYGSKHGASYVTFSNGVLGKVQRADWSDTQIIATVPYPAQTGPVIVTTEYGTSNPVNFIIGSPPILNTIGNKSIDEGRFLQFRISATDPDGNPLTYIASNLPPGAH